MTSSAENNYVGIAEDFDADKILVWERTEEGRIRQEYDPPRYFFIEDEQGKYTSIYGSKLAKLSFSDRQEYNTAKKAFANLAFESDISPVQRTLMDYYYNKPTPKINYSFFDIEAEVMPGMGFSKPSDPFAPINAITFYRQWQDDYVCIAVPPKEFASLSPFEIDVIQYGFQQINCHLTLVQSEAELLTLLLEELKDIDLLSGWNSDFYDLPYIYKRIQKVLGEKATRQLNFENCNRVREKEVERFGKKELLVTLEGRSHLDYQGMFKKFTFGGRESFKLDAIAYEELGHKKLEYNGTFYDLYHNDFIKFVHYNIIDVILIKMLDDKLKLIALVNQMAHENTVEFAAILGTTKYVDCGISNFAINKLGLRVKNKKAHEHGKVEGAIVLTPNIGLHEWVGSVDINSLYPSTIRSLNISPEKIIGQFNTDETKQRLLSNPKIAQIIKLANKKGNDGFDFIESTSKEEDWRGIMIDEDDHPHTLHLVTGESLTLSGKEWKAIFIEQNWAISGYGTVFDQSSGKGVVTQVLEFWYSERKKLQAEKKKWTKQIKELPEGSEKEKAKAFEEDYELSQMSKKLQLNSTYGALLAKGFRWSHQELMGASTTFTGRAITSHMLGEIGRVLTGQFTKLEKTYEVDADGEIKNIYHSPLSEIVYSDTDSVAANSLIRSSIGNKTIEELFELGEIKITEDKEYSIPKIDFSVMTYKNESATMMTPKWIYRHKVSKERWKIILSSGKEVIVTGDHSIMIERNGKLIEVCARDINTDTDICISIK